MGNLHVEPHRRIVSEELAESDRHLGCNRLSACEQVMERLPRNTQSFRNLSFGEFRGREDDLCEKDTRMGRTSVGVSRSQNSSPSKFEDLI